MPRPSSSQLPYLPPLGEQGISLLDGRYKLSSVRLGGSFSCTCSKHLLREIWWSHLDQRPEHAQQAPLDREWKSEWGCLSDDYASCPESRPHRVTHFSRLGWSSHSFGHNTRQRRNFSILPVLFYSPFTGAQVTGISVGCQWDVEL